MICCSSCAKTVPVEWINTCAICGVEFCGMRGCVPPCSCVNLLPPSSLEQPWKLPKISKYAAIAAVVTLFSHTVEIFLHRHLHYDVANGMLDNTITAGFSTIIIWAVRSFPVG